MKQIALLVVKIILTYIYFHLHFLLSFSLKFSQALNLRQSVKSTNEYNEFPLHTYIHYIERAA